MNAPNRILLAAAVAFALASGCATTSAQKQAEPAPQPAPAPAQPAQPPAEAQAPAPKPAPKPAPPPLTWRPLQNPEPMAKVVLPNAQNPVVTFKLVFKAGSVDDPKGKEGLTALTARVMAEGGTQDLTAAQLLEKLYPIAGQLDVQTDKELTAFTGRIHQDNLDPFLKILGDVLLQPRFDQKEFERLRTEQLSAIRNQLRGQDDETLGKVALDAMLFQGTPYAHFPGGTVQGLKAITLDDVKAQWKRVFTQDRLMIGLAGNVTPALQQQLQARLAMLPKTGAARVALPNPPELHNHAWILQKPVLSTAISMGYAWPLRRGDPDFFPVALALSYLGEHRQFNGVLFQQLREKRGLNYGDYAYVEHFIQEGGSTFPLTNIARSQQDFTLWIRPVENQNAVFATRGALHYLRKLVKDGIPEDQFQLSRSFLKGYTRLWEQTDARRLGYALDALLYGTPDYLAQYRKALDAMTAADVDAAVRRHLDPDKLNFVFVAPDAASLQKTLQTQPATPITYPTPKAPSVLEEDKAIQVEKLPIDPKAVELRDVSKFMEK